MEDGTGLQSRVIWLISTIFVVIAVWYGISLIAHWNKNANYINNWASVVNPATAARAPWLLNPKRENNELNEETLTGPLLKEHNQDKLISNIDIWDE